MPNDFPPLAQAIRATLAYFDQFDFPPTAEEVWRWLTVRLPDRQLDLPTVSRERVEEELRRWVAPTSPNPPAPPLEKGGRSWEEHDGFFTLPGRGNIVTIRKARIPINEKKWAIARRGVRWLWKVPFIKLVGVCNTVAINNAREESDIDVFIVVAKGKLWTARFFATALMDALRLRRRGTAVQDRICMSFSVTEDALDLRPLLLKDGDDPYMAFWAAQMVPLFDRGGTYARFIAANKDWVREYLPNAFSQTSAWIGDQRISSIPQRGFPAPPYWRRSKPRGVYSITERFFRRLQKEKMARNAASVQNEPTTDVVVSDTVLKFHEQDRRREYRERWKELIVNRE